MSEGDTTAQGAPAPSGPATPGVGSASATATSTATRGAIGVFAVVFLINLLDGAHRAALAAVLPRLQPALGFDNEQAGMLVFWSLVSFMAVSLAVGAVGDSVRVRRSWLLALGVAVASGAAVATGLARSYSDLRLARAGLGAGGAIYGVAALGLLSDAFPRGLRARVMAIFFLAVPVGGALGLWLGGRLAAAGYWPWAFFAFAAPGLPAVAAALALREPPRGGCEGVAPEKLRAHARAGATQADYVDMMVNSSYTYSVFGLAFTTFAVGGLAYWLPRFLTAARGIPQARATTAFALITLAASVVGMGLGGWLADRLARVNLRSLFVVPALALFASIPLLLAAIYGKSEPVVYGGIFLAEALMFANTGPIYAIIASVVQPNMRAAAFAATLFAVHLLGDLWSPTLMGWVADTFGRRDAMESSFGHVLSAIGAVPTTRDGLAPENLTAGLLVVVPALLLAGGVLLAGARHLPREMALMLAKLRATPTTGR